MSNPIYNYCVSKISFLKQSECNAAVVKTNSVQLVDSDDVVLDFVGSSNIVLLHPKCDLVLIDNASVDLVNLGKEEYYKNILCQYERIRRLMVITNASSRPQITINSYAYVDLSFKYYLNFVSNCDTKFVKFMVFQIASIAGVARETLSRKLPFYKKKDHSF